MLASGLLAGFLKVALVAVSVGGLTAGAYYAYQTGPGGSADADAPAGATAAASPTITQATPTPTAEATAAPPTPSPSATAVPTLPPAPTQPVPTLDPDCAKRTHSHLNIDKLGNQPELTGAVITEIDDSSIRVIFEGVEVIIQGVGELVGIRGKLSNDQITRLSRAIDAVAYAC